MADEIDQGGQQDGAGQNNGAQNNGGGADDQPQVGIITQYVKDLSFENPNAPASFQLQEQPRIDVSVNVGATQPAEEAYEVTLKIEVKASAGDTVAFAVELVYAGLFGLRNVPQEAVEPFLLIEAPRLLFPFARAAVANAIRDGGFPQLLLEPIDFAQLYTAQRAEAGGDASALDTVAGHA